MGVALVGVVVVGGWWWVVLCGVVVAVVGGALVGACVGCGVAVVVGCCWVWCVGWLVSGQHWVVGKGFLQAGVQEEGVRPLGVGAGCRPHLQSGFSTTRCTERWGSKVVPYSSCCNLLPAVTSLSRDIDLLEALFAGMV